MDDEKNIFCGKKVLWRTPTESFGQFVSKRLSDIPPEEITQINGDTDEKMTHSEFIRLAYQIAHGLVKFGIGAGDLVMILCENNHRGSALATACIFLNATFAPVDRMLKSFELRNLVSYYKPKLICCNRNQMEDMLKTQAVLGTNVPIVLLDEDKYESSNPQVFGFSTIWTECSNPVEPTAVRDPATEIAFVLPSSGSTGIPKGVAISHCSAINFCERMLEAHEFGRDSTLQVSHLFWVTGTALFLMSILKRPRVFINDISGENMIRAIRKYKPVSTIMSPSCFATLVHSVNGPEDVSSIKYFFVGGSKPSQKPLSELQEKVPNPPVAYTGYGCTENLGGISMMLPGPDFDFQSGGKISENICVKIADPDSGVALERGSIGEICVKYPFQMFGYYNNEAATKAAFDKDGWYLTGDFGYINEKGLLYVTGRKKTLMKYRNMQISPEEIESLLMELPGVLEAAVSGIPHPEDFFHPIGLIVKTPGVELTEQEVHKFVKDNLAPHNELRAGVFFVESLPKTGSFKFKRADLEILAQKVYDEKKGV